MRPRIAHLALLVPAALLAAWGSGAAAGDGAPGSGGSAEVRTIVLDIRFSKFSETELSVPRGTTVRFVVNNHDPISHELIVGNLAVQDHHERGTETQHGAVPGEISIPQGGTAETTYTFTTRGRLLFGCHLPGHWNYGMRGPIRVV